MGDLKFLIIGAGKMGRAHAQALCGIPEVRIVGVVSRGGTSAQQLATEVGAQESGTEWRRLADRLKPDACVVAVDHAASESTAREVLERGCHLLAEKPVAFSSRVVEELALLASEKSVVAMAAMNRRFYSSVNTAIDRVTYQGPLLGLTGSVPDPVRPFRSTGALDAFVYDAWFVANTLHFIDLYRYAAGEVSSLMGTGWPETETRDPSFAAAMRFESGAIGTISSMGGGDWQLILHGDGVEARLGPMHEGTIRIGSNRPIALPNARIDARGSRPGVVPQARAFVESVSEMGYVVSPASDFADHARSIALAERLSAMCQISPEKRHVRDYSISDQLTEMAGALPENASLPEGINS